MIQYSLYFIVGYQRTATFRQPQLMLNICRGGEKSQTNKINHSDSTTLKEEFQINVQPVVIMQIASDFPAQNYSSAILQLVQYANEHGLRQRYIIVLGSRLVYIVPLL